MTHYNKIPATKANNVARHFEMHIFTLRAGLDVEQLPT